MISGASDDREKISRITRFVRGDIRYRHDSWNTKASETLERLSGHCGNKTNLAVAMCWAAGISARFKMIFVKGEWLLKDILKAYHHRLSPVTRHCLMEVRIDGNWQEVEPDGAVDAPAS